MEVDRSAVPIHARKIVVVDDVVTRGAQLIAAATLVAGAFPAAKVGCFAALRAMSGEEITDIYQPVVGTITNGGSNRVWRRP